MQPSMVENSNGGSQLIPAILDEKIRYQLIQVVISLLQCDIPEGVRASALTLVGWLGGRLPGESAHTLGVAEARAVYYQREKEMMWSPFNEEVLSL
ncbi:hypothetical protein [Pajaroellobacter abortibovis]|uniref:Uncharacterized protein n=1 Tax=Pajaroellobacter abortibovis TaxID=1882918 RepID=A0A1L6MYF4_9BACT|nr:hypothetical protein [Pajaroellobacter abortibovis]APS00560.1 hypothetical protein BCY86_07655 [Pajaroellobacter abortibovis]